MLAERLMLMKARSNLSPAVFSAVVLAGVTLLPGSRGVVTFEAPPTSGWTLVWSDEFSGPDGSAPDSSKWAYDLGGKGWGNSELECYTSRLENAQVQGGNLVLPPKGKVLLARTALPVPIRLHV